MSRYVTPGQRVAIARKFLKGQSLKELAAAYNVSVNTISGYLRIHINVKGQVITKPPEVSKQLQLPGEKWRSIPVQSTSLLEASNYGRIKSHAHKQPKILEGNLKFGYRSISYTHKSGKLMQEHAHILIARAWLPTKPSKHHVIIHLDHDRWNNRPSNFRYVTRLEAQQYKRQSPYVDLLKQRVEYMSVDKRRNQRFGKLTRKEVGTIKVKLHNGRKAIDVAKDYGIAENTVTRIHRGLIWPDVMPQLTRKAIEQKVVPDATRQAIIQALRTGALNGKQIAALHKVDPTTVSRIKKSWQRANTYQAA